MASSTRNGESHDDEIRLWREGDGWIASHVDTGVTTQGESREAALDNLDDAVPLYNDNLGREPTDEELRELGIKSEDNTTGDETPPEVLE